MCVTKHWTPALHWPPGLGTSGVGLAGRRTGWLARPCSWSAVALAGWCCGLFLAQTPRKQPAAQEQGFPDRSYEVSFPGSPRPACPHSALLTFGAGWFSALGAFPVSCSAYPTSCDDHRCLQILPNVLPGRQNHPQLRTSYDSNPITGCLARLLPEPSSIRIESTLLSLPPAFPVYPGSLVTPALEPVVASRNLSTHNLYSMGTPSPSDHPEYHLSS